MLAVACNECTLDSYTVNTMIKKWMSYEYG